MALKRSHPEACKLRLPGGPPLKRIKFERFIFKMYGACYTVRRDPKYTDLRQHTGFE